MQAMATIHHTILQCGQELLPAHIAIHECEISLSHTRARVAHQGILYGYVPMRQAVPTMPNASIDELQIQLDILRYRFCFTLNAKRQCANHHPRWRYFGRSGSKLHQGRNSPTVPRKTAICGVQRRYRHLHSE